MRFREDLRDATLDFFLYQILAKKLEYMEIEYYSNFMKKVAIGEVYLHEFRYVSDLSTNRFKLYDITRMANSASRICSLDVHIAKKGFVLCMQNVPN